MIISVPVLFYIMLNFLISTDVLPSSVISKLSLKH